jgi:hypothetical protein
MAALSATAILAIIAAIAAAGGSIAGGVSGSSGTGTGGKTPVKKSGWGSDIGKFVGANPDVSDSELGSWFKQNYSGSASDYINSLSDAELGALLESYYDSKSIFGGTEHTFDFDEAVSELENLINEYNGIQAPTAPNYEEIYNNAKQTIDDENQQLYALLDENLARQTSNYQDEIDNLNESYNEYSRQILMNDYLKNQQLMGSVSSALSKSKQNALEAGASAGARIAGNINTVLGIQNKQTQQSLETSNQLAQAMLNQRQAAAGIRGNYNAMLNSDTQSRIGIKQGSTERRENIANSMIGTQEMLYQNKMDNYEQAMSHYRNNPFYGSYQAYNQNNLYKNKNNQGY